MELLTAVIATISLALLSLGSYFIWPSRRNVIAHLQLGFAVIAYVVPIIILNVLSYFPQDVVELYVISLLVGSIMYVLGLFLGNAMPPWRFGPIPLSFESLSDVAFSERTMRIVTVFVLLSVVGMVFSFYVMGFVPLLAADPFAAKFFRGSYAEAYQQVAIIFRTASTILIILLPICVISWYVTRRNRFLALSASSLLILVLTFQRELAFNGVLMAVGLVASRKRSHFYGFIGLLVLAYTAGSSLNYYIAMRGGQAYFNSANSFWEVVASGAPDVSDHLQFLSAFMHDPKWTYGRTFVGGLVPGRYEWNPSVWSLMTENPTIAINEQVSGGLRLPVTIWGYTAFGWLGVLLVPFVSGVIWGNATAFARRYIGTGSLMRSIVVLVFYNIIGGFWAQYYTVTIYALPSLFTLGIICYAFGRRRPAIHSFPGASPQLRRASSP